MKQLLTLGNLYMSDFVKDGETPRLDRHELKVVLDENIEAPRLENPPKMEDMFGKYWYRSGINQTMKNELKEIVDSVNKIKKLNNFSKKLKFYFAFNSSKRFQILSISLSRL